MSVPGILSQEGYQTELIGKLHLYPQRKRYGFDHMIRTESPNDRWNITVQSVNDWVDALKQQGVIEHPNNIGIFGNGRVGRPLDIDEQYHHTSWLSDRVVDFMTKYRDPNCPYFLHLSYWAPHPPLIPPQAYWDRYAEHGMCPQLGDWTPDLPYQLGVPDDSALGPFSEREMAQAIRGYYGLINHLDDRIRRVLLRTFEYGSQRQKEPTIIIFTSDHGEMLGDHHLWRKSLPYEASANVPFFISWKNMDFKPGTFNGLVSLEDVAATIFDLCGVELPAQFDNNLDSRSLASAVRNESCHTRDTLYGECTGFTHNFIVEGPWKYIWYSQTGEEQLFNVIEDRDDNHDCSGIHADLLPKFRVKLSEYLKDRDDRTFDPAVCVPCNNKPPQALWASKLN